jgi:arsenate reductase-like glutaredoxin family protein
MNQAILVFPSTKIRRNILSLQLYSPRIKDPLEKIARTIHKSLSKKHARVGALHSYQEEPTTRQRLLKKLNNTECGILAIILDKKKVYTKLQDEKIVLYNYVTNILLDRLFNKKPISVSGKITLIVSQRETNRFFNKNFKDYLTHQVRSHHKTDIDIQIATPAAEKSLQVTDFASWAIYRKYEKGDTSYYNLIKSKIIEESFLYP